MRLRLLPMVSVIHVSKVGAVASVKVEDLQKAPTASIENLLQGRMAGVDVTNLSGSPGGGGSRITISWF